MSRSTRAFLAAGAVVVVLWVALATGPGVRLVTRLDVALLEALARLRSDVLVDAASAVNGLSSPVALQVAAWTTLVVLVVVRRFQHLFAVLAVLLVVPVVSNQVNVALGRMRPTDVEVLGSWEGYSHPSLPVARLGLGLTAMLFMLVPVGRWRKRAPRGQWPGRSACWGPPACSWPPTTRPTSLPPSWSASFSPPWPSGYSRRRMPSP